MGEQKYEQQLRTWRGVQQKLLLVALTVLLLETDGSQTLVTAAAGDTAPAGDANASGVAAKRFMLPRRILQQTQLPATAVIVCSIVGGALLLIALIMWLFIAFCRRSGGPRVSPDTGGAAQTKQGAGAADGDSYDDEELAPDVEMWTIDHVKAATNGFGAENVVEDAGHSSVYRGVGPNGEKFAVKRAKKVSVEGSHLFQNEIIFLCKLEHENLTKLRAFCDEGNEQILVYNYEANGALSDWIRPENPASKAPLTFAQRLHIATGIASAIRFLHGLETPVIHRDIKSETVLLDENFNVKLGGLGLLKHLPGEAMRIRMARRKGYLDPEYFQLFKVTAKCDTYSFGVVMLELITGRNAVVSETDVKVGVRMTKRVVTLAQWALPRIEDGEIDEIIDPRLKDYPRDLMDIFVNIAATCVIPLRKNRPEIDRVAFWLEELNRPDAVNLPSLSKFVRRRDESAPSDSDAASAASGAHAAAAAGRRSAMSKSMSTAL